MAVSASILEAMAEAGCSVAQLVAVARAGERADEEKKAAKREKNRIRQQNHRARNAVSRVTEGDDALHPDKEKVAPKEITPKENPPKGGQKKSPRVTLESVLSEADADAVLEHRRALRKTLTPRAAELLASKLAAAPETCGMSAGEAANLMIEKGWQSFEPDWAMKSRPMVPPKPPPDSETWRKRLVFARERQSWPSGEWGPRPGLEGCLVPKQLLEPSDGQGWREWEKAA